MELRDLINRKYEGKQCTYFEYVIEDKEGMRVPLYFTRDHDNDLGWGMLVVLGKTGVASHQVYEFNYCVFTKSMPLENVAAVGLRFFQHTLKEEIQNKCNLDFIIGEVTAGM